MLRIGMLVVMLMGLTTVSCLGQEDGQIYQIKNRRSDKVLAPDASGALLVQTTANPANSSQQWKLVKSGDYFKIMNVSSGKVLRASRAVGQQIAIVNDDGEQGTRGGKLWAFEKQQSNFTIQSRLSDLYLDVLNGETGDGVQVIQEAINNRGMRGNQIWDLVPANGT
jgi:hypothetical protein